MEPAVDETVPSEPKKKRGRPKGEPKPPKEPRLKKNGMPDMRSFTSAKNAQKAKVRAKELIMQALKKNELPFSESDSSSDDEDYYKKVPLEPTTIPTGSSEPEVEPTPEKPKKTKKVIVPVEPPDTEESGTDEEEVAEYVNSLWSKKLSKRDEKIRDLSEILRAKEKEDNEFKNVMKQKIARKRATLLKF